ncbi:ABC transporter permease subunit [Curtobacterium flaccumfaciens]|nr:ABC transporter permease subunit [Curtobacterium flaccumfaciens]
MLVVVLLWSLAPGLFTGQSAVTGDTAAKLQAPSAAHWFGTDYLGRDLYARVVHGTASSVTSALVAVAIGLVVGGLIGLASGFLRGWVDVLLGRVVDVLLAIPGFLLAVVIVSSLGFHTINAAVATGISAVAAFARLARAETHKARGRRSSRPRPSSAAPVRTPCSGTCCRTRPGRCSRWPCSTSARRSW